MTPRTADLPSTPPATVEPQALSPPATGLTARAVGAGLAIGFLLNVANTYLGLKIGFWDSGSITAAVLGFAMFSALRPRRGYSAVENNVTETVASAAGAMPAAVGLLGAIPALGLLGHTYPTWVIAAWGTALGVLGVLGALALHQRLLVDEALPFPTGTATAGVISAMHSSGRAGLDRARALLVAAGIAALVTLVRDGPGWIPATVLLPLAALGVSATSLSAGLSASPLLFGVGAVAGLKTGASLALGSGIAWIVLGPRLVAAGVVKDAGYEAMMGWLIWPGVALLLSGASTSIVGPLVRGARAGARDLGALLRGSKPRRPSAGAHEGSRPRLDRRAVALALAAAAVVVAVGAAELDLSPLGAIAALALGAFFVTVCGRAAGQTDISPAGEVGQLTQAAFGVASPGHAVVSLAAGGVVTGMASQAATSLWSFKTGLLLGAPRRDLGWGALVGAVFGGLVAVPVYSLLTGAFGIATEALPAPSALQWKAFAEAVGRGLDALPPGALEALVVAAVLGLALALAERTRIGAYVPSPVALGIGCLIPGFYSNAILAGALVLTAASRLRPALAERHAGIVGSGVIAGESIMALVLALLGGLGLLGK